MMKRFTLLFADIETFASAGSTTRSQWNSAQTAIQPGVSHLDILKSKTVPRNSQMTERARNFRSVSNEKHLDISLRYGLKVLLPALILDGTWEILLSNFTRHNAQNTAGQTKRINLYEGMDQVFQPQLPNSLEIKAAFNQNKTFSSSL